MSESQMPCGQCPAGTYAVGAVINGHDLFAGYATRKAALAAAPRCVKRPDKICMGCRDFIVAFHQMGCPALKEMLPDGFSPETDNDADALALLLCVQAEREAA